MVSSSAGTYPKAADSSTPQRASTEPHQIVVTIRKLGFALSMVAVSTAAALALRPYVTATNLAMLYLLSVVAVALRCPRQISVFVSFLSVAVFDFFCVPPYYTFRVQDYEYLLTFGSMLVVALVISTQTSRLRRQASEAVLREARSQTLYILSRRLSAQSRVFDIARITADYAGEVFHATVIIFLPEDGRISFHRRSSDRLPISREEESVAQWVLDHGELAGPGARNFKSAAATYVPLRDARQVVGVMAIMPGRNSSISGDQMQLVQLFAHQTAVAMENTRNQNAADASRIKMQTEQMRSSLLSAVSHDLRTPLASITGAASTLRSQGDKLLPETREELLETIGDEAERLSRLVSNLLDMTRLESGIELRRELYPLEEIVGAALQRLERQMRGRQVTVSISDQLPMISVDDVLFGQLLINLLENALKYTPEESAVEIAADLSGEGIRIDICDRGPGFEPGEELRIFEKFYRGRAVGAHGAGLGLAICRAIAEAHRGSIEAFNRSGGGAVFRIRLPLADV